MVQCKLTVLVCKGSDGLQLTSILKPLLSVSAGALSCEGVQLPFVKSFQRECSVLVSLAILSLKGHLPV